MSRQPSPPSTRPGALRLQIDHLVLPAGVPLPPGGLAGLQAAIAQALTEALTRSPGDTHTQAASRSHDVATQIAHGLLPQLHHHLDGASRHQATQPAGPGEAVS